MNPTRIPVRLRKHYRTGLMVLTALALTLWGWVAPTATAHAHTVVAVCDVKPEEPHASIHVGGTINAVGRLIRCRGRHVPDLHMDVQLQKRQHGKWRVVPTTMKVLRPGRNLVRIGRARICSTGTYRTRLRIFGFGRHDSWLHSKAVRIPCGPISGGGSGGGGGGGW